MNQPNLFSLINGISEIGNRRTFRMWILRDVHSHRFTPDNRFRLYRLRSICIKWEDPMCFIPPDLNQWSVCVITTFNVFDMSKAPRGRKADPQWHRNWRHEFKRSFRSLEECEFVARRLLDAAAHCPKVLLINGPSYTELMAGEALEVSLC